MNARLAARVAKPRPKQYAPESTLEAFAAAFCILAIIGSVSMLVGLLLQPLVNP